MNRIARIALSAVVAAVFSRWLIPPPWLGFSLVALISEASIFLLLLLPALASTWVLDRPAVIKPFWRSVAALGVSVITATAISGITLLGVNLFLGERSPPLTAVNVLMQGGLIGAIVYTMHILVPLQPIPPNNSLERTRER